MPQQAFCVALKLLHISAANLRKLKMWAGSIGAVVEFLPKRPARFGSEDLDVPAWKAHMRIHECRDTVILQLRRGELLGLTWNDVDFANKQVFVTRSVVKQVVGKVKTLASQKAMPLDDQIISDLMAWHGETKYKSADSYVFASGGFASTRDAIWRTTSGGLLRVARGKNISGLGQFLRYHGHDIYLGQDSCYGHGAQMPVHGENRSRQEKDELQDVLIDLFRRSGGRVVREPVAEDVRPDLVLEYGGKKYLIEFKRSSEGRRDRLVPLLSQAVLQAQAMARHCGKPFVPMAVVAAPRISDSRSEEGGG